MMCVTRALVVAWPHKILLFMILPCISTAQIKSKRRHGRQESLALLHGRQERLAQIAPISGYLSRRLCRLLLFFFFFLYGPH